MAGISPSSCEADPDSLALQLPPRICTLYCLPSLPPWFKSSSGLGSSLLNKVGLCLLPVLYSAHTDKPCFNTSQVLPLLMKPFECFPSSFSRKSKSPYNTSRILQDLLHLLSSSPLLSPLTYRLIASLTLCTCFFPCVWNVSSDNCA